MKEEELFNLIETTDWNEYMLNVAKLYIATYGITNKLELSVGDVVNLISSGTVTSRDGNIIKGYKLKSISVQLKNKQL